MNADLASACLARLCKVVKSKKVLNDDQISTAPLMSFGLNDLTHFKWNQAPIVDKLVKEIEAVPNSGLVPMAHFIKNTVERFHSATPIHKYAMFLLENGIVSQSELTDQNGVEWKPQAELEEIIRAVDEKLTRENFVKQKKSDSYDNEHRQLMKGFAELHAEDDALMKVIDTLDMNPPVVVSNRPIESSLDAVAKSRNDAVECREFKEERRQAVLLEDILVQERREKLRQLEARLNAEEAKAKELTQKDSRKESVVLTKKDDILEVSIRNAEKKLELARIAREEAENKARIAREDAARNVELKLLEQKNSELEDALKLAAEKEKTQIDRQALELKDAQEAEEREKKHRRAVAFLNEKFAKEKQVLEKRLEDAKRLQEEYQRGIDLFKKRNESKPAPLSHKPMEVSKRPRETSRADDDEIRMQGGRVRRLESVEKKDKRPAAKPRQLTDAQKQRLENKVTTLTKIALSGKLTAKQTRQRAEARAKLQEAVDEKTGERKPRAKLQEDEKTAID